MDKIKSFLGKKEENKLNPEEHIKRLREVLQPECEVRGSVDACHQLGEFYQIVEKNLQMADTTWRTNCYDRDVGESCFSLGYMLLSKKDDKDVTEALTLFEKACKQDVWGACHNAGLLYHSTMKDMPDIKTDSKKAIENFTKACDGGYRNSCFYLSAIYLNGTDDVNKDLKKAQEYSVTSCDMGHGWACANLARMYMIGDGVEKDENKASAYKKKAKQLMKGNQ